MHNAAFPLFLRHWRLHVMLWGIEICIWQSGLLETPRNLWCLLRFSHSLHSSQLSNVNYTSINRYDTPLCLLLSGKPYLTQRPRLSPKRWQLGSRKSGRSTSLNNPLKGSDVLGTISSSFPWLLLWWTNSRRSKTCDIVSTSSTEIVFVISSATA